MVDILAKVIKENRKEVEIAIEAAPDWSIASMHFNSLFNCMANPQDLLWSKRMMEELSAVYYKARDEDKSCSNITERTVNAMPKSKANDTKKILLQIANVCRILNAGHKVNFGVDELPEDFDEIPMASAKKKGFYTYASEMPALYPKISLTFDYWVPKIFDWTQEIREKQLKTWQGEDILQYESCTDFMRICLLFLSDPLSRVPLAKTPERETLLKLLGEEFLWIKKSDKREDILGNNEKIAAGLKELNKQTGIEIPLEAWSRIIKSSFFKSFIK
ncbi:MAG: hypothetical protein JXR82_13465 [Marinifilaceae bacterium]|nr:hypothetical protein [Marinifilaceae bacterium]